MTQADLKWNVSPLLVFLLLFFLTYQACVPRGLIVVSCATIGEQFVKEPFWLFSLAKNSRYNLKQCQYFWNSKRR